MRRVPILILDDPTSGIDVGAKDELLYRLVAEMTADGTSVIITSSELPELLALSDRILVLHEGHLVGTLEGDDRTQENVLRMAVAGMGLRTSASDTESLAVPPAEEAPATTV